MLERLSDSGWFNRIKSSNLTYWDYMASLVDQNRIRALPNPALLTNGIGRLSSRPRCLDGRFYILLSHPQWDLTLTPG